VPVEEVGVSKVFSLLPLSITPPISGQFLWEDKRTLVLKPKGAFQEATRYAFRFRDDFRDVRGRLLAGRHDFTLFTEPLRVIDVKQVDYTTEGGVVLECSFSLPVLPQKLRGFLVLFGPEGNEIPYSLPLGPASTRLYVTTAPLESPTLTVEITEGLTSERGPLGLESVYRKVITATYAFEILGYYVYFESPERCVIAFNTSTPVDPEQLTPFIQVTPEGPFTVRRSYGGFAVVGPFLPRERKVITVKKGAQARNGAKLLSDFTQAVIIPDLYPSISFPVAGLYVSSSLGARIPVTLVNVPKVRLTLWRLYDNNIPIALANLPQVPAQALGELVREDTVFNDSPPNTLARKAIDLVRLTGGRKGTYLLVAQDASENGWAFAEYLFAFTDIGIVAKVFPQGILVWANSLSDGSPLSGAWVKVFSRTNQLLFEGTCNEEGVFLGTRDVPWGEKETPYIVTVQTERDLSFVTLEGELFATSGFDVTGKEYLRKGYEAFLFLPRGVFRPGEELRAQAIVRGPQFSLPPSFPVKFVVRNPLGRSIGEITETLSSQGSATLAFAIPENAPTGAYTLSLSLPDGKTLLAEKVFLVEEFVPPRIRLEVAANPSSVRTGEDVTVAISGEYLFGRKADSLPYSAQVTFESAPFAPPDFATYTFGNGEISFTPVTLSLGEGVLDAEGKATFSFTIPSDLRPPAALTGKVTVTASDPGGRPVASSATFSVFPYPLYFGLAFPEKEFEPGEPIVLSLVALDPSGNLKETEATIRIFRILRHFVLSSPEEGGGLRYREEEERIPEVSETVSLPQGKGTYTFTPETYGEYLVEVTDPASSSTTTRRLFVFGRYGFALGPGALPDRVILALGKPRYAEGEEAVLSYRAPFAGKALFTIETDRIVSARVLDVSESGEIRFPVTREMFPNAYCSLVVLQEGAPKEGLPLRALGVVPLFVEASRHRLGVTLEVPDRAKPGKPLSLRAKVTDSSGNPVFGASVTFALVDVGILTLTDEPVPDPFGFFTAKRRLGVGTFDLYSSLVLGEPETTPLLHPAGGAPKEAFLRAQLSFLRPALFRIVSVFAPDFTTDAQGEITATFDLPDVATTLRVVAVVFKDDRFGSSAREVTLQEDLVFELTHPRVLAPGDSFVLPVTVFSQKDTPSSVTLALVANDLLEVMPKDASFELPPRGKEMVLFTARAKELVGDATLELAVRADGEEKRSTFRFPVRPPFPRIPVVLTGKVEPGETVTVEVPRDFIAATLNGKLFLSGTPDVDLRRIATFLWDYPYGCLEQVVSSAWVALLLPEHLKEEDPLLAPEELAARLLDRKIRRILSLQTYDGGFSSWPQGESTPWNTAYALHFLLSALDRGVAIPREPLEAARDYLLRFLVAPPYGTDDESLQDFYTTKAYAAYVLSLFGERPLATLEELREKRLYLRNSGLLFLALTYASFGQRDLAQNLAGNYTPSLYGEPQTGGVLESPLREGALALLLSLELDPTHAQAANLVANLQKAIAEREYLTTQEGAFLLFALSRYYAQEKRGGLFSARLSDERGNILASFTEKDAAAIDIALLPPSPWKLTNEGGARLFYALVADGVPLVPPEPWDRGIQVRKTYLDRDGNPLENGAVEKGDEVVVLLDIEAPAPLENVVIVDLLPGGLEPTLSEEPQEGIVPAFVDRRDDRILIFFSYLEGKVSYRYRTTAVTSGTFTVPPVKAECMYNPGISSLSGGGTLKVE
ncbi:MAG: alpha-2-macroglobulin family protein, partial [Candidatus Caldatribacterium sp.]|nr:alpha-2-macroglobulin family protein [Candidatus Caldatribacterium sp.]